MVVGGPDSAHSSCTLLVGKASGDYAVLMSQSISFVLSLLIFPPLLSFVLFDCADLIKCIMDEINGACSPKLVMIFIAMSLTLRFISNLRF